MTWCCCWSGQRTARALCYGLTTCRSELSAQGHGALFIALAKEYVWT
jgi:hypothetical protein